MMPGVCMRPFNSLLPMIHNPIHFQGEEKKRLMSYDTAKLLKTPSLN